MNKVVLLLLICRFAYAQPATGDTLNQVDPTGLKQGYWIVYNSIKKLPSYPPEAKVEEGKFADLVILDQDILKIEEKDIPKTKVIATYVNGEKVFGN